MYKKDFVFFHQYFKYLQNITYSLSHTPSIATCLRTVIYRRTTV